MIYLITYANDLYRSSQKLNAFSAKIIGDFDGIFEFKETDLPDTFKNEHAEFLKIKRGNGLWIWKPYIILQTLEKINDGDIVFYCDSGAFFFKSIKPVIKILANHDIWTTDIPLIERQFTKKDTFNIMDCSFEKYGDSRQVQSGFIALRKNEKTVEFIREWYFFCNNITALNGFIHKCAEEPDFISHREDQSILSLLIKKHGYTVFQDPTQFSKYPEKYHLDPAWVMKDTDRYDYKPFILLHRSKNRINWLYIIRQFLSIMLPHDVAMVFSKT